MLRQEHNNHTRHRTGPALSMQKPQGEGSTRSLRCQVASACFLVFAVLESAHDAGQVQASGQRVQEHLVLLHTFHELLQRQFPWDGEKDSQDEVSGVQGSELDAKGRGGASVGAAVKDPERKVWYRDPPKSRSASRAEVGRRGDRQKALCPPPLLSLSKSDCCLC